MLIEQVHSICGLVKFLNEEDEKSKLLFYILIMLFFLNVNLKPSYLYQARKSVISKGWVAEEVVK